MVSDKRLDAAPQSIVVRREIGCKAVEIEKDSARYHRSAFVSVKKRVRKRNRRNQDGRLCVDIGALIMCCCLRTHQRTLKRGAISQEWSLSFLAENRVVDRPDIIHREIAQRG